VAARSTGYSGTPLIKKLGVKPGMRVCILNAPAGYSHTLGRLPPVKEFAQLGKPHTLDFIQFFTRSSLALAANFARLSKALVYDGMLWISWPKQAAKVETDLNEGSVRRLGLAAGLVDVKVAIDETWSGLKFVYRLEDRPGR
jgi:hypothetical protein